MSIDVCKYCSAYVDTDFDADCYIPDPAHSIKAGWDMCLCERCLDKYFDELEEMEARDVS